MKSLTTIISAAIITTRAIAAPHELKFESEHKMPGLDIKKPVCLDIYHKDAILAAGEKLYRGSLDHMSLAGDAAADVKDVVATDDPDVQYLLAGGKAYSTAKDTTSPVEMTITGLAGSIDAISAIHDGKTSSLMAAVGTNIGVAPALVLDMSKSLSSIDSLLGVGKQMFVVGGTSGGTKQCIKLPVDQKAAAVAYDVKHTTKMMSDGTMVYMMGGKGGSPGLTVVDSSKSAKEGVKEFTKAPFDKAIIDAAFVKDAGKKDVLAVLRDDNKIFGSEKPTDPTTFVEYTLPKAMGDEIISALGGSLESGGLAMITTSGNPPQVSMVMAEVPTSRPSAAANLKVSVAALGVVLLSITALLA